MNPFPHRYTASCRAACEGDVVVASESAPSLTTAAPPEFGGPGGRWTPETLLVAAAVDCLALTFRAMATVSKLEWRELECDAEGILDRVDGTVRFIGLRLRARLLVAAAKDVDSARRLLEKSERGCLVTRSLCFEPVLESDVAVAP
jgi:organic hydroperoxide reductase OsmC/OhrA